MEINIDIDIDIRYRYCGQELRTYDHLTIATCRIFAGMDPPMISPFGIFTGTICCFQIPVIKHGNGKCRLSSP